MGGVLQSAVLLLHPRQSLLEVGLLFRGQVVTVLGQEVLHGADGLGYAITSGLEVLLDFLEGGGNIEEERSRETVRRKNNRDNSRE